jgi:pilus assembly protein CpaB
VTEEVPTTILTIAVTQEEAERLIHADRTAELTFALLTEDTDVRDKPTVGAEVVFPELLRAQP